MCCVTCAKKLTRGDVGDAVLREMIREVQCPLLMTRRTELPLLGRSCAIHGARDISSIRSVTRKRQEQFVSTVFAPDSGESFPQVAAFQKFSDNSVDHVPEVSEVPGVPFFVDSLELPVMTRHQFVEWRVDGAVVAMLSIPHHAVNLP